jgi:ABC-type uncharacterized transport system ATPase subunit
VSGAGSSAPRRAAALALGGITKRFGTLTALADATLTVAPGSIHAVLGENGAGKTTLLRIAFGMLAPDAGTLTLAEQPYAPRSPREAMHAGVGMVHQHYSLVPSMTVAENVILGRSQRWDPAAADDAVRAAATTLGFSVDPRAHVADLTVAEQQRVELIKCVARGARVLILDEPTAVLAPEESRQLLARLREFAAGGGAVVLITHQVREALAYADAITVLRGGRTVLEASTTDVTERAVISAMVGDHDTSAPQTTTAPGAPVLQAMNVSVIDALGVTRVRDASLAVHAGEIVGLAGVDGGGQAELLRVLAGRLAPTRGTLQAPDSVGFVPADRHRDALLLGASLTENFALATARAARGRLDWRALRAATAEVIADYDVRGATPSTIAAALSGGNQQKFVVGRAVATAPTALVIESPSRGLDVRASAAIHDTLRARRHAGMAIVISSPDLDELLALADRIVVCHAGRLFEVPRTLEAIGRAMVGAAA